MQTLILNIGTKQGNYYKDKRFIDKPRYNVIAYELANELSELLEPEKTEFDFREDALEGFIMVRLIDCGYTHNVHDIVAKYARVLQQDCIGVAWIEGSLIGKGASDWGNFNPDYFTFK